MLYVDLGCFAPLVGAFFISAVNQFIATHYGYPNASIAGIDRALDVTGFAITGNSGLERNFRPEGIANTDNNCRLRYIRAEDANTPPLVEVFSNSC